MIIKNAYKLKSYYFIALIFASFLSCEDDIREVTLYEKGLIEATTSSTEITVNETVSYEDFSTKTQSLTWTFNGGNPATSFNSKVNVDYTESGVYITTQEVKYIDNQTEKKEYLIYVYPLAAVTQESHGGSSNLTEAKIQMEDFDYGGEGISYHDTDSDNQGSSNYRFGHGVDIEITEDEEGDFDITNIANGEWLEYTIFVANASIYDVNFRLLADASGSTIKVQEVDGATITDLSETAPILSSDNNYTTVTAENVSLSAGEHVLRILFTGSGIKTNYFEVINTVFVAPVVKYAIYTEDTSVEQSINPADLSYFSGNAYDLSESTDAFEGSASLFFKFQKIDTWGVMGIMEISAPIDASEWDYYHISLKTTSLRSMRLRIRGGGINAFVVLDDAIKTYGLERDGNWHNLKIPLSDFVDGDNANALPDLTSLDRVMVLRSHEGTAAATDDWDYYVDNIYLSKE